MRIRPPSVRYGRFTIEDIYAVQRRRVDFETNRPRNVLDGLADNAGNAALIVGGRPMRPMDLDLRRVAALCYRNNVVEQPGVAAVLNHPADGVAWLANKLAPLESRRSRASWSWVDRLPVWWKPQPATPSMSTMDHLDQSPHASSSHESRCRPAFQDPNSTETQKNPLRISSGPNSVVFMIRAGFLDPNRVKT